jgi:hypothetical protein
MSKILKSIVGLAIITSSIGFAATPAKAESKAAQCQRFSQTMVVFTKSIAATENRGNDNIANADQLLNVMATGLKKLQRTQFSDPKIRSFQQSALNIYAGLHDNLANVVDAAEKGDRATAINAYQQLLTSVEPEARLRQQFRAYCGRPK